MPWIICGICTIITIICIIKLQHKQHLDIREKITYEKDVATLLERKQELHNNLLACEKEVAEEQARFRRIQDENNKILAQKALEIDEFYDAKKLRRLEQLENEISQREATEKQLLQNRLDEFKIKLDKEQKLYADGLDAVVEEFTSRAEQIETDTKYQEERFNSLLAPLQQYEKDKQAKLFYTIQVPDEYKEDIDFLLTTVSKKVQHPDIINKLIWAEYVKPYIDETFKRVGIESKPGIYKLTNINDGKTYIGKSTDIKKRITDHFKASIGIQSIADQAIHHAILKTGFWNWSIECITYCEKEQLNELEKYYIDFFKAQEYGYNKKGGG